ncbi:hypothetical protein M2263_001513 [Providencia alcalifaciens]|nr:hypothetical protein [Providencia alcalifaciens]
MRLGFLAGAILAGWLTLAYPTEVEAIFNKLKAASLVIFSDDSISPESSGITHDSKRIDSVDD